MVTQTSFRLHSVQNNYPLSINYVIWPYSMQNNFCKITPGILKTDVIIFLHDFIYLCHVRKIGPTQGNVLATPLPYSTELSSLWSCMLSFQDWRLSSRSKFIDGHNFHQHKHSLLAVCPAGTACCIPCPLLNFCECIHLDTILSKWRSSNKLLLSNGKTWGFNPVPNIEVHVLSSF